ncbi:MAG TPA: hypothetical protein VFB07_02350 [Vicinamibacterales bacterium]|nr:hypothetical protein [Vicinamibacterales bacterium]
MISLGQRLCCAVAVILSAASASAQPLGAGAPRAEWCGFPAGALVLARHTGNDGPDFANYGIGTSFAWNLNARVGVEAEAGFGVGWTRASVVRGVLVRQAMPDSAMYSGSLVVSPIGSHRRLAPYVVGALGALSLLPRNGTDAVGVATRQTMPTAAVGAGVKWYVARTGGVRADYRVLVIDRHDEALPLFGETGAQVGHRMFAGIFTTF